MRVARYNRYGPADVIDVVWDDERPIIGDDEILVEVVAVGINPADTKERRGRTPAPFLPAGMGREFAGIVTRKGILVDSVDEGDKVIGTGQEVLRDELVVAANMVTVMPEELTWDQAAVLPVAGQTAWLAVESQNVQPGDVCVVSAAAGGVGHIICQLLVAKGATVIGTASRMNHQYLEEGLGVIPLEYGEHLAKRLEQYTPQGIHHVFDQSGSEMIEAALELGVPRENINSISGMGSFYGVPTVGRQGLDPEIIDTLAQMVIRGELVIPIKVFPMDEVRKAYIQLEEFSNRGKIVVRLDSDPQEEFRQVNDSYSS